MDNLSGPIFLSIPERQELRNGRNLVWEWPLHPWTSQHCWKNQRKWKVCEWLETPSELQIWYKYAIIRHFHYFIVLKTNSLNTLKFKSGNLIYFYVPKEHKINGIYKTLCQQESWFSYKVSINNRVEYSQRVLATKISKVRLNYH